MKKTILIAALSLFAATAFCQSKPDTTKKPAPPKPVFKPDLTQQTTLDIKFKVPGNVVNDYMLYKQFGENAINHANDISAARATELKESYRRVTDSLDAIINRSWIIYITDQQKKFTADTTAKKGGGKK